MAFNYVWTGNPGSSHDATVLSSDLFSNSNEIIPPGFICYEIQHFQYQHGLLLLSGTVVI